MLNLQRKYENMYAGVGFYGLMMEDDIVKP